MSPVQKAARMKRIMTMMMIKRTALVFCFILSALYSAAQETDFGIWSEVNTEFGLLKRLDACASLSLRTFDNSSKVEQGFAEAGLQYKVSKNFSVTGSYRLIRNIEDDSKYYYRHKMFIDLKYSQPVGNLKISARVRMQRATKTYIEDDEDLLAKYYGRMKLKSEYDIPSVPVTPFAYVESFTPLFSDSKFEISKYRLAAGTEIRISRRSSFEAGYLFQQELKKNTFNSHILLFGYNLKF